MVHGLLAACNFRRYEEGDIPYPYADTLFDFRRVATAKSPICTGIPATKRVAIVGAGAAGCCAGYELLRTGCIVTVFEATNRCGGRLYSATSGNVNKFELGAMRVPPSEALFWQYATQFGMASNGLFPDPGKVPTSLYFQNQETFWPANTEPPAPFDKIQRDLFDPGYGWFDVAFLLPYQEARKAGTLQALWQTWLDRYSNQSFYGALAARMTQAPYFWNVDNLNQFGTLGVGSGGFSPLYPVGFMEMIRLLVYGLEDDQRSIPGGVEALTDNLLDTEVNGKTLRESVQLNHPVKRIRKQENGKLTLLFESGENATDYDAVIVACTTYAMQSMGLTESDLVDSSSRIAIRNLNMMSASKLFLQTKTKFWNTSDVPRNIQTDEYNRGVFCVDYPENDGTVDNNTPGVVLMNYTVAADSTKTLYTSPSKRQRYEVMYNALKYAVDYPPQRLDGPTIEKFVAHLPTPAEVDEDDLYLIDWQLEPYYQAAYKFNYPGQEPWLNAAYYQFQSCLDPSTDTGVYLAGDGVSWTGGWIEGALETAFNAATAVVYRLGSVPTNADPVKGQSSGRYNYFGAQNPTYHGNDVDTGGENCDRKRQRIDS